jgi:regulator of protease activity HflC (stomatin/prohibitin superfamily)
VPTAILNLNWAKAVSEAHNLDTKLESIIAKSKEGFVFHIDLQVLIHVPDAKAPRVISMVGTMQNLVNEVLQAAVGNLFRDKLGSMPAIEFIETRQRVQQEAFQHIRTQLEKYEVEVRGVYIQDVVLPQDVVKVLTEREIANQEIATFRMRAERADGAREHGEGEGHGGHAGRARAFRRRRRHQEQRRPRPPEGRRRRGRVHRADRTRGGRGGAGGRSRARRSLRAPGGGARAERDGDRQLGRGTVAREVPFVPQVLVAGGGGALDGLAATLMAQLRGPASRPPAREEGVAAEQETSH